MKIISKIDQGASLRYWYKCYCCSGLMCEDYYGDSAKDDAVFKVRLVCGCADDLACDEVKVSDTHGIQGYYFKDTFAREGV